MFEYRIQPEEVQYMGVRYTSTSSVRAIDTIVNSEHPPKKASVVTWMKDRRNSLGEHLFLFWDWNDAPLTVVHSAFTSGYSGGGPHDFSEALCMLQDRKIPTTEIFVDKTEFDAIEERMLTEELIRYLQIQEGIQVQGGYIFELHQRKLQEQVFWAMRHQPRPNFDFLDPELAEVCRGLFEERPLAAVSEGFKVLEDRLRELVDNHTASDGVLSGEKLLNKAFNLENGVLADKTLPKAEREGVFLMYKGVFQFIRNPLAHKSVILEDKQKVIEYLYLVDLLLRLLPEKGGPTSWRDGHKHNNDPV